MKAVNIIHELTINDYGTQSGVITVERGDNPWNAFCTDFGSNLETIFSPKSTAEIVKDGKRNFLYIYDERFPERDNELFAILRDYNDDSYDLIYLYEIE